MYHSEFAEFLHHLTDNARLSLKNAESIARNLGSAYIGTEHLLLGVLSQDSSVAAKMLAVSGVTIDRAQLALKLTPKSLAISGGGGTSVRALSETAKLTLRLSWDVAQEFNQDFCGTEHILYSILSQKNARATVLLRDMKVDIDELMGDLEQFLNRQQDDYEATEVTAERRSKKRSLITHFGIDLTAKARKGELDPVIGRDPQIKRMITILGRRTKNNPVLLGEPGVGKTAIVEGLAQRIVAEDVPEHLIDKQIVTLDLAGMIAGTKYRGEFEERLRQIIDELVHDRQTIVFIDEIHLLVGAGAAEGAIDAANMLKPALARGQLQLVGATTLDEYKKHIEKDAALERRLQTIIVPEPSLDETIAILHGVKRHYEAHHHVQIDDEVVAEAAHMAKRYIGDRFMPDKAIDLLDEAAAQARIDRGKNSSEIRRLTKELKHITARMESAVDDENYERAARYKTRMSQITEELSELRHKKGVRQIQLTSDDIARTVAQMTGVPVRRVLRSEARHLLRLEEKLSKQLIGQSEAVTAVAKAIRRNRSGITDKNRPIGSFIFLGPTGVGKTELARILARELYANESSLIKIDMSEFGERHTASRLVGAPAGYVGYEEGGQLTDKVRRQPYSLILFDEIEKAHPEVFNLLLQILEDGQLTDAKGRKVDFRNTLIILTSNIGAEKLQKEAALGFRAESTSEHDRLAQVHDQNSEQALEELKKLMRPELLNRFDKRLVFRALTRQDARKILDLQLNNLAERLATKGINIKVMPLAKQALLEKGYDSTNGVRPLRRVIEEDLEDALAEGVLANQYAEGSVIRVTHRNGQFQFDLAESGVLQKERK
ncbi:MAG TPA: ATP-dependent Clp protease ATP-binding subunit [Candidatus Saccharimonadales bacterium]|nr:ATP-dependent Clp protease ATP-binding subunit [Candidatus Saccharimonadales bacterium]